MEDRVIEIYRAANALEADLLKGILEEEGIQVVLAKEGGYNMSGGGLATVPIQVLESDASRAKQLIDAAAAGEFALEDGDLPDDDPTTGYQV